MTKTTVTGSEGVKRGKKREGGEIRRVEGGKGKGEYRRKRRIRRRRR